MRIKEFSSEALNWIRDWQVFYVQWRNTSLYTCIKTLEIMENTSSTRHRLAIYLPSLCMGFINVRHQLNSWVMQIYHCFFTEPIKTCFEFFCFYFLNLLHLHLILVQPSKFRIPPIKTLVLMEQKAKAIIWMHLPTFSNYLFCGKQAFNFSSIKTFDQQFPVSRRTCHTLHYMNNCIGIHTNRKWA